MQTGNSCINTYTVEIAFIFAMLVYFKFKWEDNPACVWNVG